MGGRAFTTSVVAGVMAASSAVAACTDPGTSDPPATTVDTSNATPASDPPATSTPATSADAAVDRFRHPPAPDVAERPAPDATAAFTRIVDDLGFGSFSSSDLQQLVDSGDARHAWLVADLLRFYQGSFEEDWLVDAFVELTAVDPRDDPAFDRGSWTSITNHLIAWDLPAPPDYRALKGSLFTIAEPAWAPFFDDADADIDWRWVSWGGVLIDDRPLGSVEPCPRGCIPALDDPPLTPATEGDWYPDDGVVFGIVEGDEAVALPRNVMEVHEMVNMTIGGRRFGIPYCTLCGAPQAYRTDEVPDGVEVPVLRTSGLLSRSNKVMFDLASSSVFDTFTGRAVSGPLREVDVELPLATVVVTTWGEWRATHPHTRIVAEDGGRGRTYPLDPLRGRDDGGPIFPVGDVDDRLAVHARVIGVVAPDGTPVAFPVDGARAALDEGDTVVFDEVELFDDAGGLRARTLDGTELPAHEAFWFAWSQFNPGTGLWTRPSTGSSNG